MLGIWGRCLRGGPFRRPVRPAVGDRAIICIWYAKAAGGAVGGAGGGAGGRGGRKGGAGGGKENLTTWVGHERPCFLEVNKNVRGDRETTQRVFG